MKFLSDFKLALDKKKLKNQISFYTSTEKLITENQIEGKLGSALPTSVKNMFLSFNGLKINQPRSFELLEFSNVQLFDDRFLFFARMDETQRICFDMGELNFASEWNIVN